MTHRNWHYICCLFTKTKTMNAVSFYFQVHQPYRIKNYGFFDIASEQSYFDSEKNLDILNKVIEKCYLPANETFYKLIKKYDGRFKISYSLSGVFLEQCETWRPDVIESFRKLVDTGCVEILAETYYHSLSFLYSKKEFDFQVKKHAKYVKELFGVEPKVFRNTELIYNNEIAHHIHNLGYKGIIAEGVDRVLNGRTPNYLHHPPGLENFPILLKNYKLSDDIAFRFSNKGWSEHPLSSERFASWVHATAGSGDVVNLFMDYETFGEHQWSDTGIFQFLEHLPEMIFRHPDFTFLTPSEVIDSFNIRGDYDVQGITSWADMERDLSAWRSNPMQHESLNRIYAMEESIMKSDNKTLIDDWRKLTTSDHFYYMCTKYWSDGDVHKYFSPYNSPTDAYIYFVNAINDLEIRLEKKYKASFHKIYK